MAGFWDLTPEIEVRVLVPKLLTCYAVVMDEDEELAEYLDWIDRIKSMDDDDFHTEVRPYFDSTDTMKALPREESMGYVLDRIYKGRHRA